MRLLTNINNINEELTLIYNIFADKIGKKCVDTEVNVLEYHDNDNIAITLMVDGKNKNIETFGYKVERNETTSKYIKRYAKIVLYKYLSKITRYKAPWGALTGVRPTKIYYELLNKLGGNIDLVMSEMQRLFLVSKEKINQLRLIANEQSVVKYDHNSIDLYINIPFCTSKCYYCSFISMPLNKCQNMVEPYIEALTKEIKATLQFLQSRKMTVNTIYFGGGTPTAIGRDNLEKLLNVLPKSVKELTVEAGRPDTIDNEMLAMLDSHGVSRISINPQTFKDETLKLIGRNHTADDVVDVYRLARKYHFVINMDLIAGLGNEKLKDFKYTLNKTIGLYPDNITVHTLSIKRASTLKSDGGKTSNIHEVERMVKYSIANLAKNGYKPYYLYRQKNMLGNLENTGYCRDGKICEFNINSMEETLSVIACGANAISKKIDYAKNRIDRHANVKNIQEYISRIDEMIQKKLDLFDK